MKNSEIKNQNPKLGVMKIDDLIGVLKVKKKNTCQIIVNRIYGTSNRLNALIGSFGPIFEK